MSYFVQPTVTIVLNPDDDAAAQNTVVLRKWTGEERQRVASLSLAPINVLAAQQSVTDGGRPEILIDIPRQRIETVKACVASWSGPDFDGRAATPGNVALLPPDILDLLADACDRLNQGITEDEKKVFATPTSEQ